MLIFLKSSPLCGKKSMGIVLATKIIRKLTYFSFLEERKDRPFASHLLARQYPASLMVTETDLLPSN